MAGDSLKILKVHSKVGQANVFSTYVICYLKLIEWISVDSIRLA
jgi:hypothetical protein